MMKMKAMIWGLAVGVATTSATAQNQGGAELENSPFAKYRAQREKASSKLRADMTKKYDKNGNGRLDKNEYKEAGPEYRKRYNEVRDRLEAELEASYDSDGDGKLSPSEQFVRRTAEKKYEEARRAKEEEDRRRREEEYRRRLELRRYDKNENGKLDEEELSKMKADKEARIAAREAGEKKLLGLFDEDKDGKFNEQEMAKVLAHLKKQLGELKSFVDVSRYKKEANDRSWDDIEDAIREFRFR